MKATSKSLDDDKQLPAGCLDGNRFRRKFVPTYISWVAQHATDPWKVADEDAIKVMRKIWANVYKGTIAFNATLSPRCKVVITVSHRF